MAGRGKRAIPAAFRLPKDIVDRLDSIASAPGSTRIAQGLAPPKNWLKISGQGSLGYIKVGCYALRDHCRSASSPSLVVTPSQLAGRSTFDE